MSEKQRASARKQMIAYNKSEKHRKAVSLYNSLPETREIRRKAKLGAFQPEKIRLKISKTRIERGVAKKEKNPMFGKTHSEVAKNKCRIGVKRYFENNPEAREHLRKCRLKQIIPYVSNSEVKLKEELNKAGLNPISQYSLGITQIDLAFPEKKIAIYVDGCYWHCCPIHYPNHNPKGNQDNYVNEFLKRKGWKVLRFWEHDIKDRINKVREGVVECVSS